MILYHGDTCEYVENRKKYQKSPAEHTLLNVQQNGKFAANSVSKRFMGRLAYNFALECSLT